MKRTDNLEWSRYYALDESGAVGALHARFVTHRYARHEHDYFVVGLVESGVQAYSYRGARHTTPAGQVFLVDPGEPHTGEAATPGGYVYRTVYPSAELLASVAEELGARGRVPFFNAATVNDPILARRLMRFHAGLVEEAPRAERDALLLEALGWLIARHSDVATQQPRARRERFAVRRAREYMESHFGDEVSLSALADVASLSPYYFARAFSREIGLPPHAYLEGVRIRKARELLDRGQDLASVALAVGYFDQSHFTHRFKRFLGITPGQYAAASERRPRCTLGRPRAAAG